MRSGTVRPLDRLTQPWREEGWSCFEGADPRDDGAQLPGLRESAADRLESCGRSWWRWTARRCDGGVDRPLRRR